MSVLPQIQTLKTWLESQILGQPQLVERILIALIADGHLLVEGAGLSQNQSH